MSTPEEGPPQAVQLPADTVEEVEEAESDPRPTHPIVLPEEPPVISEPPVGPVDPDAEVPTDPYPDNGLPELPDLEPPAAPPEGEGPPVTPLPEEPAVPPEEAPAPVELDAVQTLANIVAAARKRCAKAKANPSRRGPPENTLACQLADAADKYPSAETTVAAIQAAAEEWLAGYTGGPVSRRHTLAQRIVDGRYNVAK